MTKILIPKSLAELLPNINNEEKRIAAGCTDIMVATKNGRMAYKDIIDINGIEEIKAIYEEEGKIYIGSNVALSTIINDSLVKDRFPILIKALEGIGSPQIRNRATMGGNLQNASPSGDGILALTVLGAKLVLSSLREDRCVDIIDFVKGPGKTDLKNDEFIKYIVIPTAFENFIGYYEKVGLRNAMVISVASMAALYSLENNKIKEIRIAYGAVAPKVIRAQEAEKYLKGKELNKKNLLAAGELVTRAISPIDDIRASAEYRKQVCKNLILRLLVPLGYPRGDGD